MNRPALTNVQRQLLDLITAHVETHGFPPSLRELTGSGPLSSTASVTHQLWNLENKGYIRRNPNRARAITVIRGEAA